MIGGIPPPTAITMGLKCKTKGNDDGQAHPNTAGVCLETTLVFRPAVWFVKTTVQPRPSRTVNLCERRRRSNLVCIYINDWQH